MKIHFKEEIRDGRRFKIPYAEEETVTYYTPDAPLPESALATLAWLNSKDAYIEELEAEIERLKAR